MSRSLWYNRNAKNMKLPLISVVISSYATGQKMYECVDCLTRDEYVPGV